MTILAFVRRARSAYRLGRQRFGWSRARSLRAALFYSHGTPGDAVALSLALAPVSPDDWNRRMMAAYSPEFFEEMEQKRTPWAATKETEGDNA